MNRIFTAALFIALATACATATPVAQQSRPSIDQRFGDAFADVEDEEDRAECRERGLPSNCNDK